MRLYAIYYSPIHNQCIQLYKCNRCENPFVILRPPSDYEREICCI